MIFVKTDDLKTGMRLARPVYNKNGVLLYDRDSRLTVQGINSIKNFGLIGIFVLEPAEPVPPMTQDDIYFERFQTIYVFAIKDELDYILQNSKTSKIQSIAANIIKNYGHMDRKINFMQNLRSKEDYIYKHSLNTAILCAMITHNMNVSVEDQLSAVTAAIVHDIGKLSMPKELILNDDWTELEREQMKNAEAAGIERLEMVFPASPAIKRICLQTMNNLDNLETGKDADNSRMVIGARILSVAEVFDTMTAMQIDKAPVSEVSALKYLLAHPEAFDEKVVKSLCDTVKILYPGVSIELNTGAKGLVLVENPSNILKPMILTFYDNRLIDLSNKIYDGRLEIADIMKTMDNRHVMNIELLKLHGIEPQEDISERLPTDMRDPADKEKAKETAAAEEEDSEEGEEEYIPGVF